MTCFLLVWGVWVYYILSTSDLHKLLDADDNEPIRLLESNDECDIDYLRNLRYLLGALLRQDA